MALPGKKKKKKSSCWAGYVKKGVKKKGNKIEIFFNDFFAPKLFKDLKTRSVIALLFAIMIGIFLAFAFQIKASEKKMVGKIVDVIETGYMLGEKILRYPKVVVAN